MTFKIEPQVLIFVSTAIFILTVIYSFISFKYISYLNLKPIFTKFIIATVVIMLFIHASGLLSRFGPFTNERILYLINWISFEILGFILFIFVLIIVSDVGIIILKSLSVFLSFLTDTKYEAYVFFNLNQITLFYKVYLITVFILSILLTVVGTYNARKVPDIKTVNIEIGNGKADLELFRLVQLSDIHVGLTIGKNHIESIVKKVNSLNPDVVVITGDIVDGSVKTLGPIIAALKDIKSKNGIFISTGNHEYYFNVNSWLKEFKRLGLKPLINSNEIIKFNNIRILIAGIPDYRADKFILSHLPDPQLAIENADISDYKILLSHQPKMYEEASLAGYDLMLTGHTHGGQMYPWKFIVNMIFKYAEGLNKHNNMWIYTSLGTGYWGPPIRLGSPSEITLFEFVKK